jgi:hypothetical protein
MGWILKTRTDLASIVGERGLELGVDSGAFSRVLLKHSDCQEFYSIDRWAGDRGHDGKQYLQALRNLQPFGDRSLVMRMDFTEALGLFPDRFFSFVYFDGYAHTGQEEGATLADWFPKVRPGGWLAGHDYCLKHFKLNCEQVDAFIRDHGLDVQFTQEEKGFPSWFAKVPHV